MFLSHNLFTRNYKAGFTLAEVFIATGILGLLLSLHLLFFQIGFSSWQKIEVSGYLHQQLMIAGQAWMKDCQIASANFIDSEEGASSMLSPQSEGEELSLTPGSGNLVWRQTILYYLANTEREFRRRLLKWPTPSPDGAHISDMDFSYGIKPLSYYRSQGKTLARGVDEAKFSSSDGLWKLELKSSQVRYGRQDKESAAAVFMARPRNL